MDFNDRLKALVDKWHLDLNYTALHHILKIDAARYAFADGQEGLLISLKQLRETSDLDEKDKHEVNLLISVLHRHVKKNIFGEKSD